MGTIISQVLVYSALRHGDLYDSQSNWKLRAENDLIREQKTIYWFKPYRITTMYETNVFP